MARKKELYLRKVEYKLNLYLKYLIINGLYKELLEKETGRQIGIRMGIPEVSFAINSSYSTNKLGE